MIEEHLNSPMYAIANQEKHYLQSEIHRLMKTIDDIKNSYSYAAATHYKEVIRKKDEEIEQLATQIRVNETTEQELVLERNRFKEGKEKTEAEILVLHDLLHEKEKRSEDQIHRINELEKELLQLKLEKQHLSQSLSETEESNRERAAQNDLLLKDNNQLINKAEGMKAQIKSQKAHINDLNRAVIESEKTKKEIIVLLTSKTEELERLVAERKHTITSLEHAKEQLIMAEKEKMEFIKNIIHQYEKTIEDNEWWFGAQFADIDKRSKEQEQKMERMEGEQEERYTKQQDEFFSKFQEVEEKFHQFIGEMDSLKQGNEEMTNQLFQLKHLMTKQKRDQKHYLQNLAVPSDFEEETAIQSKNN
ncbi:hypothetical protein LCM10_01235 [Rossellomorea aquimaris]|uniref:hypothetical protein n=1 Tax=Rossellomorea aquimaris TaxID=189382 RepID=UPI001CD32C60|nr:hypothetical protein [Rossellomorea aquimaris]MCA1053592.1 hypothetical protein [Rossellomorea aquimaris]